VPRATTSTLSRSAITTTSRAVGRPRADPSFDPISEPVEKLSPPTESEGTASTSWSFERADGSIIKMSHPMGIRCSWSKGEVRVYVGANKHYSAVLTNLQNAWSDGITTEFTSIRSPWAEEEKKKSDEMKTTYAIEELIRSKSAAKVKEPSW
jgi:hypothetical protein